MLRGHLRIGALSVCALFNSQTAATEESIVAYEIRPKQLEEHCRLDVTMIFDGNDDGVTRIQLLQGNYGTPRLWDSVTNIRAGVGVTIGEVDDDGRLDLTHEGSARISFAYTVDFTGADGSYRPSVGSDHFHFLGPQWMARVIGEEEIEQTFRFTFLDVPAGWRVFGSFGVGPGPHEMESSWDALIPTVLGGGRMAVDPFTLAGRPVVTYVQGDFEVGAAVLFDSVQRIVSYQRQFFDDPDHELLVVTLVERDRRAAGTSIVNAMVCFADPDYTAARIQRLLAHEMFHQWLPRRGAVEPGDWSDRFEWIDEGFTEYFARRLMLDQHLIDTEAYVELFNSDLEELAKNPYRDLPNEGILQVVRDGEFTPTHFRLPYLRGALVALNWNSDILGASNGARSLNDFMRDFMTAAMDAGGKLPQNDFHALLAEYHVDSREDMEAWIDNAAPIKPRADAMGPEWRLEQISIPDPGFRRRTSVNRRALSGVREDGPAYAAGLRNGMRLVSLTDHLDGLGAVVVVVEDDGTTHEVVYEPVSRIDVWQFRQK